MLISDEQIFTETSCCDRSSVSQENRCKNPNIFSTNWRLRRARNCFHYHCRRKRCEYWNIDFYNAKQVFFVPGKKNSGLKNMKLWRKKIFFFSKHIWGRLKRSCSFVDIKFPWFWCWSPWEFFSAITFIKYFRNLQQRSERSILKVKHKYQDIFLIQFKYFLSKYNIFLSDNNIFL